MKIKTSELIGPALDWAVAKCEGLQPLHHYTLEKGHHVVPHPYYEDYDFGFTPSTDWRQGGPIIDRERIELYRAPLGETEAWLGDEDEDINYNYWGPTPLIAAMRCYVASKLGDEVDIPEALSP